MGKFGIFIMYATISLSTANWTNLQIHKVMDMTYDNFGIGINEVENIQATGDLKKTYEFTPLVYFDNRSVKCVYNIGLRKH